MPGALGTALAVVMKCFNMLVDPRQMNTFVGSCLHSGTYLVWRVGGTVGEYFLRESGLVG